MSFFARNLSSPLAILGSYSKYLLKGKIKAFKIHKAAVLFGDIPFSKVMIADSGVTIEAVRTYSLTVCIYYTDRASPLSPVHL